MYNITLQVGDGLWSPYHSWRGGLDESPRRLVYMHTLILYTYTHQALIPISIHTLFLYTPYANMHSIH